MDKEELKKAQLYRDYYKTFNTDSGKNVLEDLENDVQEQSSFVPGDPHGTAFNEGRRDLFRQIRQDIKIGENPEKYLEKQQIGTEE